MKMIINDLRRFIAGREDDGEVMTVEIDCSAWRVAHPHLTDYRLEVKSPSKIVYFPVVKMDGNILVWEITQSDTEVSGIGQFQVIATGKKGARKTSMAAEFVVASIISGTASDTPPRPSKPWTDEVASTAKRAEEAAKRIEEMGGVSDEQVAEAIEEYLKKNPIEGGASIDDDTPSDKTTYSSKLIEEKLSKLNQAIGEKVGTDELNTAVEDALTEAKESGDFKGDPGDPGAEGPQGPAGYTPQRGTDYWTVADQRKIVADVLELMPESGGNTGEDEWELINTITLDEDTEIVRFSADKNGLGFELDAFYINAIAGASDGNSARLAMRINGKPAIGSMNLLLNATTHRRFYIDYTIDQYGIGTARAISSIAATSSYPNINVSSVLASITPAGANENVKSIDLYFHVGETNLFTSGSTFELYGVRRKEVNA